MIPPINIALACSHNLVTTTWTPVDNVSLMHQMYLKIGLRYCCLLKHDVLVNDKKRNKGDKQFNIKSDSESHNTRIRELSQVCHA